MSETNSDSPNIESFEIINDLINDQKNEKILISPSLSSTSTEFVDDLMVLNENEDSKMDIEVKDQPIHQENIKENLLKENNLVIENVNEKTEQNNELTEKVNQIVEENNEKTETPISPSIENQKTETNQEISKINQLENLKNLTKVSTDNFLNWFSNKDFINKVTENAVNSFNSVIITLDPGMKEIRLAGGDINVLVTSNHSFSIDCIRDGFIDVFKRATVKSIESRYIETAIQLVGIDAAHRIGNERIKGLRENISIVAQNQVVVTIENFLYNFGNDRWYDSDYFLLDDPLNKIQIGIHTQGTPISSEYIEQLSSKAPTDHKFREDGFNVRIDKIIADDLKCSIQDWHEFYVGFDKGKIHHQATVLLSNLYKKKLKIIGRLTN